MNYDRWLRLRNIQRLRDVERFSVRAPRQIVTDRTNPFEYLTEDEFLVHFRLPKECVRDLIEELQEQLPEAADRRGSPVPPHLQVLITLSYFASGGQQEAISDSYHISQSCVSGYLRRVAAIIAGMCREKVKMPTGNGAVNDMQQFKEIAGMGDVVGVIDCIHIAIRCSDSAGLYQNKNGYNSLNIQAVCGPNLEFFNVVARWWGSEEDGNIFNNSKLCHEFENGMHRGKLLGDMEYPCRKYLLTPLLHPQGEHELAYNKAHAETRTKIECAFGVLKRRFCSLRKCMKTSLDTTKNIIVAAVVLHNMAIERNAPLPDDEPEPTDEHNANKPEPIGEEEQEELDDEEMSDDENDQEGRTERATYIHTYF